MHSTLDPLLLFHVHLSRAHISHMSQGKYTRASGLIPDLSGSPFVIYTVVVRSISQPGRQLRLTGADRLHASWILHY